MFKPDLFRLALTQLIRQTLRLHHCIVILINFGSSSGLIACIGVSIGHVIMYTGFISTAAVTVFLNSRQGSQSKAAST